MFTLLQTAAPDWKIFCSKDGGEREISSIKVALRTWLTPFVFTKTLIGIWDCSSLITVISVWGRSLHKAAMSIIAFHLTPETRGNHCDTRDWFSLLRMSRLLSCGAAVSVLQSRGCRASLCPPTVQPSLWLVSSVQTKLSSDWRQSVALAWPGLYLLTQSQPGRASTALVQLH